MTQSGDRVRNGYKSSLNLSWVGGYENEGLTTLDALGNTAISGLWKSPDAPRRSFPRIANNAGLLEVRQCVCCGVGGGVVRAKQRFCVPVRMKHATPELIVSQEDSFKNHICICEVCLGGKEIDCSTDSYENGLY